ncbi:hypothetical protein [Clostridium gasigenes]|uniref:Uncharacterized protein n=1 Tax=Clostridium gasigenes TaxID=94869 RepID=A0A7X0VQY1_9CLOT|nr:hypothetical protein [Clostridium gasigenes]MBB6714794.1 hypothetical protein [Clostridium gasigenes]
MNKIEEYKTKLTGSESLLDLMYETNEKYQKLNNYIEKYLFYREQKDCIDVCKYNMFIYGTCYGNITTTSSSILFKQKGEEYELLLNSYDDDISFRGDTAINCMSILMQIVKYENSCDITKKQTTVVNEMLKDSCLLKDNDLRNLLEKHAMLCYSVGNFYPIPFKKFERGRFSLNTAKGRCISEGYKDNHFDDDMFVFLEDMYMYFVEDGKIRGAVGKRISNAYTGWIDYFGKGLKGWKHFVNTYYLNSFVDNNYYPIQFWKMTDKGLKADLENYLKAVNFEIEKRAKLIMTQVNAVKKDNAMEQLLP